MSAPTSTYKSHTPGPWQASEPNGRGNGWRAGPAWLGMDAWSDETRANARLVAAAPELLAALQSLTDIVLLQFGEPPAHADGPLPKALATIRKATGSAA